MLCRGVKCCFSLFWGKLLMLMISVVWVMFLMKCLWIFVG